jgi:hypothetical protein
MATSRSSSRSGTTGRFVKVKASTARRHPLTTVTETDNAEISGRKSRTASTGRLASSPAVSTRSSSAAGRDADALRRELPLLPPPRRRFANEGRQPPRAPKHGRPRLRMIRCRRNAPVGLLMLSVAENRLASILGSARVKPPDGHPAKNDRERKLRRC